MSFCYPSLTVSVSARKDLDLVTTIIKYRLAKLIRNDIFGMFCSCSMQSARLRYIDTKTSPDGTHGSLRLSPVYHGTASQCNHIPNTVTIYFARMPFLPPRAGSCGTAGSWGPAHGIPQVGRRHNYRERAALRAVGLRTSKQSRSSRQTVLLQDSGAQMADKSGPERWAINAAGR